VGSVVGEKTRPVGAVDVVIDFVRDVAVDLRDELRGLLVAIYLHGSSVLGDFDPLLSDIDLLVIVDDSAPVNAVTATGDILHSSRPCPALGIEASAVSAMAAREPRAP
jgi:hypothetical protein